MKYRKTLTPVQVSQIVKALILLGESRIVIEKIEKDHFAITTTQQNSQKVNISP